MRVLHKKALLAAGLALACGSVFADITSDYYIQSDKASLALDAKNNIASLQQEQINWLLDQGYAPVSVILSSVGRGFTLADTVYFMSRARPQQAMQFLDTAAELLPSLPGWVCSTDEAMNHRYDQPLTRADLPGQALLAEAAEEYFDNFRRFLTDPDWQQNEAHLDVTLDELIAFKEAEIALVSPDEDRPVDSWWYLQLSQPATDVHAVSLYPRDRRVVVDTRLEELLALREQGMSTVPVMLMYNDVNHLTVSDIERVPVERFGGSVLKNDEIDYLDPNDGEITASEVINRYQTEGLRLSPTREWRVGDYHLDVRTDELMSLFEVPEREDIDPATWDFWEAQLRAGLQKPMHMTLFGDADNQRWLQDKEMVAVARELDIKRLPIVFFYHNIGREPCGMPTACLADVEAAARAGGLVETPTPILATPLPLPSVIVPPGIGPVSPN